MQTKIQKNPDPDATVFIWKLIWFAMLSSVGALYFVAYMDESNRDDPTRLSYAEIFANPFIQQFFVAAVITAVIAFFLPKMIGKRAPGATKLEKAFVPFIIRLTLSESIAIYGLVAYFTVQTTLVMHPFLAISVLLMLITFPTRELLEDFVS